MTYHSQCGQDEWIDRHFGQMRGGIFVEAGAHDGVTFSNTCFLERERGWTGLCVEPNPDIFQALRAARTCHCLNAALGSEILPAVPFIQVTGNCSASSALASVMDYGRLAVFQEAHGGGPHTQIMVPQARLMDVFAFRGITHIDYFSLDTDGNELDVLAGIDFTRTNILAMSVENTADCPIQRATIENYGFTFSGRCQWDDMFLKK